MASRQPSPRSVLPSPSPPGAWYNNCSCTVTCTAEAHLQGGLVIAPQSLSHARSLFCILVMQGVRSTSLADCKLSQSCAEGSEGLCVQ